MKPLDIGCWLILAVLMLLFTCGCTPTLAPTLAVGDGIARADARVDSIMAWAKKATGPGTAVVEAEAKRIKSDLAEASQANAAAGEEMVNLRDMKVKLQTQNDFDKTRFVGQRALVYFKVWIVALALALALRIAGLFVSGVVGTVLAYTGSLMLAILSFGLTLGQGIPDNLFFRRLVPASPSVQTAGTAPAKGRK